MVRSWRCTVVGAVLLLATAAHAQDFRLFGAAFGMTKAELGKVWSSLEGNQYYVKDSVLFDVAAEFDHGDRLYQVGFSVPIDEKHPSALAAAAFQNLVTGLWGKNDALTVTVRTGRGSGGVTITHRRLQAEYVRFIETQLTPLIRP